MPLGLGIDLGTTNTKVVLAELGRAAPRVRAAASAPTPEPGDLRATLHALLGRVLDGSAPPDAVGIASMAETGVPLGDDGAPLTGWLRWTDRRAAGEADALARRLGRDQLVAATGVRPSAKAPLAKWSWLRAQGVAMTRWAGAADLAGLLLTGRLATDHTLAGRTMAYRLPGPGEPLPAGFDAGLLAEAGLCPAQLPAVMAPGEIAGRVRDRGWGLRAGTPVVIAGHDHPVGAFACGVRRPGEVADSLGTAEAVMTVVAGAPDPVEVGRAGMSTVITVGGRHRAVVAGSPSAGAAIDWWLTHENVDATIFDQAGFDQAGFDQAGPEPTGILVLPYPAGRQAPDPDPGARLRVIGRRPEHTPAELARALLEGLCLHTRWMLAEQVRLSGTAPAVVHLLGGPIAANALWTRIRAAVLPAPIRVIAEPEAVAVGAAMRACGVETPLPGRPETPAEADYDAMFEQFVAAARKE
ncbi:MAG TPA: FGGY-family carbohydrate kinase [Actinoplanes sp.]|nr:FGGY-family carbohydrate kinase [Actinoplanes sp.]